MAALARVGRFSFELTMDMYLQEIAFWRREIRRRIEEGTVSSHIEGRSIALSETAERQAKVLAECRPEDKAAIEAEVRRLIAQIAREASDAVRQRRGAVHDYAASSPAS